MELKYTIKKDITEVIFLITSNTLYLILYLDYTNITYGMEHLSFIEADRQHPNGVSQPCDKWLRCPYCCQTRIYGTLL